MKQSLFICLFFCPTILTAQISDKKEKRFSTYIEVALKKNFLYNRGTFENMGDVYSFRTRLQPMLLVIGNYRLNKTYSINAGISVASSKYRIEFDYQSQSAQYKQTLGVGVTTYKLPLNLQYDFDKKIYVACGLALNYHLHNSLSSASSYSVTDSFSAMYYANSPFVNKLTISNQVIISGKLSRRSFLTLQFDIDWGTHPVAILSHEIKDYKAFKFSSTNFSGSPRMYYVALGLKRRLW